MINEKNLTPEQIHERRMNELHIVKFCGTCSHFGLNEKCFYPGTEYYHQQCDQQCDEVKQHVRTK